MKIVNLVLTLAVLGLGYLLFKTIYEPIAFDKEYNKRNSAVIEKLTYIKDLQLAHKDVHGEFSKTFDDLERFVMKDSIEVVKVIGDPDQLDADVKYIVNKIPVRDTLISKKYDIKKLDEIPFVENEKFSLDASTIERGRIKVPVFEVSTPYTQMLKGLNTKYIDPNKERKIGSLMEPNYNGNWERR